MTTNRVFKNNGPRRASEVRKLWTLIRGLAGDRACYHTKQAAAWASSLERATPLGRQMVETHLDFATKYLAAARIEFTDREAIANTLPVLTQLLTAPEKKYGPTL